LHPPKGVHSGLPRRYRRRAAACNRLRAVVCAERSPKTSATYRRSVADRRRHANQRQRRRFPARGGLQERLGDPVPLFELVVSPRGEKRAAPTLGAITSSTLPPGSFCKLCILGVEERRVGLLTSAMPRRLRRACRADERTRTADLISLRVRSHAFTAVSRRFRNYLHEPWLNTPSKAEVPIQFLPGEMLLLQTTRPHDTLPAARRLR
jgi:hypothetical protein